MREAIVKQNQTCLTCKRGPVEIGGKTIAEDKMAARKIMMAEELLNAIMEPFTKVVCKLHDARIVSVENFKIKKAELMKTR